MRKKLNLLFLISAVALVMLAIVFWVVFYEGEKPLITVSKDIQIIGRNSTFDITCSDMKSGLRHISVSIAQDGTERVIHAADFTTKGHRRETVSVQIDYKALQLHDGTALLQIAATDRSLRENRTVISRQVQVDVTPPVISLLNPSNYINPGGTCLITFTLSEPVTRAGVSVNDEFFTAYRATQSNTPLFVCYFASPLDAAERAVTISVSAEDGAGNTVLRTVPFHMRHKKFRSDTMRIGDRFLENKIPEFSDIRERLPDATPLETFVYINEQLRAENISRINELCSNPSESRLWDGTFLRLNNAATMAYFGDKRTYYYHDEVISKSIHMGVDLASIKNAIVEASNSGIITFTGYIGIFGNTVIIDHGQGLFSFYAHLSTVTVDEGQQIKKGAAIGRTGMSGLAGGDHLHFGILVGHRFVNPKEWWDPHWIRDNVKRKLDLPS